MFFEKYIVAGTELVGVGTVISTSGLKGSLKVIPIFFNSKELDELLGSAKSFYIEQDSFPKKLSYKNSKVQSSYVIVSCAEFNSIKDAQCAENRKIFVSNDVFTKFLESTDSLVQYLNYQVQDNKMGVLGNVVDFMIGKQNAIVVKNSTNNAEIIIPFVEPIVNGVSKAERKIFTDLPEGFLE